MALYLRLASRHRRVKHGSVAAMSAGKDSPPRGMLASGGRRPDLPPGGATAEIVGHKADFRELFPSLINNETANV